MTIQKSPQQLQMLLPVTELDNPRQVSLPEGYSLHLYEPKYAAAYIELMHLAGFKDWDGETLCRVLRTILPNGLYLIIHDQSHTLVATAMATHNPTDMHPFGGELGWVAAHPEHAGKGLGAAVCTAVMRRYAEAGYQRVYLRTDDWRLPAIKTYLKLGWLPFLFSEDMEGRWRAVCEKIQWQFTSDQWPRAASQTAAQVEDNERPNVYNPEHQPLRRLWLPNRTHRIYPGGGDVDAFGDESLYKPSALGRAKVEPCEIQAGARSSLRLAYTTGPSGLPEGTRVSFGMRGQSPLGAGPASFTIETSENCTAKLIANGCGFVVQEGCLNEGDRVALISEPFDWTPISGRREFKVTFQFSDDQPEQRLPEPLVVYITPLAVHHLDAVLPCTYRPGEEISVLVTARDANDNRVPINAPVTLTGDGVSSSAYLTDGRAVCSFRPTNREPVRVSARAELLGIECESNPSVAGEEYQLYVGDLHCHDFLSEAEGYPDQVYRWAIEDRKLDFISVVPQSHGWHDNQTWTITKYMNERFLDERRFITFLGFEWQHTGYGDKVIHYLGGDQPYLPVDDPRYSSPSKLYKALRGSDTVIISHHVGYPAGSWCPQVDFGSIDTNYEPVMELWSMHGSCEGYDETDRPLVSRDPRNTIMDALRRGLRFGFVAGSDTHSARPGGSAKEPLPYWGGLAAVWAKDLTRRSIFEAIRARRTYALTRARIVLKMTVNGAQMGSELLQSDTADIQIRAWAPGDIRKVEIIKNTKLLKSYGPFGSACEINLQDCTEGPAFYHCRVTLSDGELAVCSPVWVG